jgi:signal transduction histidine kinase
MMTTEANEPQNFRKGTGLSTKLLFLTIAFVMLAEVLIFVPSIANFRNSWIKDRLAAAGTAALVLEAAPEEALPEKLLNDILMNVGAETIALRIKGTRKLLAVSENPLAIGSMIDMRETNAIRSIIESFDTLLYGGDRLVGVTGAAPMEGEFIEIVIKEKPLRTAMIGFAFNILLLSLVISAITAALVYFALRHLIVRPVEKLTKGIVRFAKSPEDLTRLIKTTGRNDEIGVAENALLGMQQSLSQQMKQKEHLASLGLAVSKINHDLRNMLTSAQLISDRLGSVQDPTVQRFAPKLVETLDRAIAFCQSTLAYGHAEERPPEAQLVHLKSALDDIRDNLGITADHPIHWQNRIPDKMVIATDPEYLIRICTNLCRNALQAMQSYTRPDKAAHVLSLDAGIAPDGWRIEIGDTGPGIPTTIRQKLFEAFHGSTKVGGTGLGLAIAAELTKAQGGTIRLLDKSPGAHFEILLPKPQPKS